MDKKAKDILFKTYWQNGWIDKNDRKIDPENFAYAKEKGLMFDPITISHDDCIKKIIEISAQITIDQVAKAFLCSLSTRRLDWRSGISSYFIAKLFIPHQYTAVASGNFYEDGKIIHTAYTCGVCKDLKYGVIGRNRYENQDLSILNFERIKWGGVRHGDLIYTFFDLQQFEKEHIPEPTREDVEILNGILNIIASSQQGDYPSILRDRLKEVPGLKSSKDERSTILEILACIDILKPASYDRPTKSKHDWIYVEFWRGEDKYNQEAINKYFAKYISEYK